MTLDEMQELLSTLKGAPVPLGRLSMYLAIPFRDATPGPREAAEKLGYAAEWVGVPGRVLLVVRWKK